MKINILILIILIIPVSIFSSEQFIEPEIYGIFSLNNFNNSVNFSNFSRPFNNSGNSYSLEQRSPKAVKNKKFGRAVLYMGSIWIVDSIRYWATYADWVEDWQYQLNWEDQKKRFFLFDANKFDSNPFRTNWTHGIGGAVYFNIARYHRLNLLESVLFETATSMIWEYFTEWREVVSINDNFFSGLGGMPIGEPFFQLSKYLLSRKGTLSHIAGYILNPVFGLSDLFGGKKWRSNFMEDYFSSPDSTLSLSNESFSFRDNTGISGNRFSLNIGTGFLKIPGFGEPGNGREKKRFSTTFLTSINFGLSIGNDGIDEYRFNTKVIYLGSFHQKIEKDKIGKLKGYSFYYGLSSAFNYFNKRSLEEYDSGQYHYNFNMNGDDDEFEDRDVHDPPELPVNFTDKMAVVNLFGPSAHIILYSSPFKFEINTDAYFDFGLVNSLAINKYSEEHNIFEDRIKTTLAYYGYYYAFGYTLNIGTRFSVGNLSFNGGIRYQDYVSIQGLDRFQDKLRNDNKVYDSRSVLSGAIGYHIPGSRFSVSLLIEKIGRRGTFEDIIVKENETRIFSSLNFHF
ncbi:MAG: DUF3943 domain-containing protein [Acidobacteriota bacterium]